MDAAVTPSAQEPQWPLTHAAYDLKLYTANYFPDATATAVLNGLVHKESKELDALEEQTVRLHAKLTQLEKKKRTLLESRRIHQAFLAPIRKLPAEILGMIFTYSLVPEHGSLRMSLLLGNVCQRWKHVTVGTPQLWTTLLVESSASPRIDPTILIESCIEYSGSLPLTLLLSGDGKNWSGESGKSAMQMICRNMHRVECISGTPGPLFWKTLATGDTPIHAPLLKTIDIRWELPFDPPRPAAIRPRSIIRAPNLASLALDLCGHLLPILYSEPGKLQHLTLRSVQEYEFVPLIAILSRASELYALNIDLACAVLRPEDGPLPIYLHSLRELSMGIDWDTEIRDVFGSLRTPSLERLTLVSLEDEDPVDVTTLQQLFLDGPPRLRELTLEHMELDSMEFTSFISELPALESLCLSECKLVDDGENILYSLTLHPSVSRAHWLCPAFHHPQIH